MNKQFDIIITFATFDVRLHSDCVITMLTSILNQKTDLKYHIVMNVYKEHVSSIKQNLKDFIDRNNIELFVCNTNLKSHNKYFYVMQKYRDLPIIIVDDDLTYPNTMIQELYDSYLKFPNCVHGRRCHLMKFNNDNSLKKYNQWEHQVKKIYNQPDDNIFITSGAGSLYPPNILNIQESDIDIINKTLTNDDFTLKYFELKNNVKVVNVKNNNFYTPIHIENNVNLYEVNCWKNKNDEYLYLLNPFFKIKTIDPE